ncbi:16015_t:CDS:2 [Acaulospora colombiana]|uniref:16015_t:CDS:1 n=1 Tax=Acaulospora colombiana TaxID=27376 RepID=A0ACA9K457_9GLOM|nr:16015_t:CDS:2 [Acaulospora colombiana]
MIETSTPTPLVEPSTMGKVRVRTDKLAKAKEKGQSFVETDAHAQGREANLGPKTSSPTKIDRRQKKKKKILASLKKHHESVSKDDGGGKSERDYVDIFSGKKMYKPAIEKGR